MANKCEACAIIAGKVSAKMRGENLLSEAILYVAIQEAFLKQGCKATEKELQYAYKMASETRGRIESGRGIILNSVNLPCRIQITRTDLEHAWGYLSGPRKCTCERKSGTQYYIEPGAPLF